MNRELYTKLEEKITTFSDVLEMYIFSNEKLTRNICIALFATLCALFPFVSFRADTTGHCPDLAPRREDPKIVVFAFRLIFVLIMMRIFWKLYIFCRKEVQLSIETRGRTQSDFNYFEYSLYRLDYLYSQHKAFKPILLLASTVLLIAIGALLWHILTGDSLGESVWACWTFIADPGTHSDNTGLTRRLLSLFMTLGGMIIFAVTIGMVGEDIASFVENFRRGKSRIIDSNHTLILGQGDKLIPTIQQIALANASLGGGLIVILTEWPKQDLEELLEVSGLQLHGSDVIVRSGFPHLQSDLRKVSAITARSIVVLADRRTNADMTDVNVVRTVLSLRGMGAPQNGHIVCEVSDVDNEDLVHVVGQKAVETFVSHDVIGRLMIQCARERGLAQVLESLLGFEGCEFYIETWDEVTGVSFGELMFRFRDAIVVGIVRKVKNIEDRPIVLLNPSLDTVVNDGDSVIVIAEDDDTYAPVPALLYSPPSDIKNMQADPVERRQDPEKMLFIGWRRDVDDMIVELDSYVAPGSQLTLFCQLSVVEREARLLEGGLSIPTLQHLAIEHVVGNPTSRKDLENLALEHFDSILILADQEIEQSTDRYDMMHADSKSLTCLLLIRDIQSKRHKIMECTRRLSLTREGVTPERLQAMLTRSESLEIPQPIGACIISEILDVRTKPLISVASVTDYVASNELLSMAIAMVAEQRYVNIILKELFSSDGNEIYLHPVLCYVKEECEASFFDIMHIAKLKGELVIGYKDENGVYLNPDEKNVRRLWDNV